MYAPTITWKSIHCKIGKINFAESEVIHKFDTHFETIIFFWRRTIYCSCHCNSIQIRNKWSNLLRPHASIQPMMPVRWITQCKMRKFDWWVLKKIIAFLTALFLYIYIYTPIVFGFELDRIVLYSHTHTASKLNGLVWRVCDGLGIYL